MQLNGLGTTTVMAASEPPEPPPRNPDKINASLKQLTDQKAATKSLDISDKAPKLFKSILSLDNAAQQQQQQSVTTPTSVSCSSSSGVGGRQPEKSPTIDTAATSTATSNTAGTTNQSTGGEFRGAASTLFSAATTTISNKINELVNGSIAITGGGIGQYTEHTRQDSKITSVVAPSTATIGSNLTTTTTTTPMTTITTPTVIDQHCSGEDGGVVGSGSNNLNNSAAGDYANGDTLNSIDQKNLVFPNESATVYVERRQTPSESGSGSRRSREFDELGKFMNGFS